MTTLIVFVDGGIAATCLIVSILFCRFWRVANDRLFAYFSLGFAVLAAHWAALGLVQPDREALAPFFVLRLAGFLLFAYAILDKNRRAGREP